MYSTEISIGVLGRFVIVNDPSSSVKSPEIIWPFAEIATDAKPTAFLVDFSETFPFTTPLPVAGYCAHELTDTAKSNDRVKYFFFIFVFILYDFERTPKQVFLLNYCLMN